MKLVDNSKCNNKIIILDCCYSGMIAKSGNIIGDTSEISKGTVIFISCADNEGSAENFNREVFTKILEDGLDNGASDILGKVTLGSPLYAYIDKALNSWQQRLF